MTGNEWLLIYLVFSTAAMICVAACGYFVAQLFSEIHHACEIKSPAKTHGRRSGPGPVWEVNSDGDEREETEGDGPEAAGWIP